MQEHIRTIFLFLVLTGCKKQQEPVSEIIGDALFLNHRQMPKKLEINAETTVQVQEWEAFKALSRSIDVLYKATNNEDLNLAIDDLLEKEKELAESNYPKMFDKFQIKSRQRVLRTYMLKVRACIINKADTAQPTIEMLQAYNALRNQLNNIVNGWLDTELILDEE